MILTSLTFDKFGSEQYLSMDLNTNTLLKSFEKITKSIGKMGFEEGRVPTDGYTNCMVIEITAETIQKVHQLILHCVER